MNIKIKSILSWTIPYFGNSHYCPYGVLQVTDGTTTKPCRTKGDTIYDTTGYQYITFNRRRYKVINNGRLYAPALTLVPVL